NSAARSTVQPTICMIILQVASLIGIHDPHRQAALLRIISGMIAVAAISFFLKKTVPLVEKKFHIAYILLSYFLWFIPYNSVRFSSETWSALAFLVAVGLCINVDNAKRKHVLIGALLGISFVFRFQTAILSGGLVLWLIFIERENKIHLVKLISTAITVAFIGLCVDFWFYSRFTFSFWNYFMANLIEGKVNNFGVSPWHDQFRLMLFGPIYP